MNIVNGEQMKFQIEGLVSSCNVNFYDLPEDTVDIFLFVLDYQMD